ALKEAVATDPELEVLTEALEGIEKLMGDGWFETRELFKKLNNPIYGFSDMRADGGDGGDLKELLQDLTGANDLTSRGLGRVLGYRVDRIAGGRKLVKRTGGKVNRFKIERVDPEQEAA
ncbi:MAG TPA: hypothetical protein VFC74_03320, partial [Oscillospiraceae bacterium]|nr:hypothetical protein [Oscillospiraceae bacterium]